MFKEYALDPKLLKNWKDFRYFTEKMGATQGRLISKYPKRWKRLVYDALGEGVGEVERSKIEEALRRIDDKLLSRGGGWDSELGWLENAEIEHKRTPFSAILGVGNPRNLPEVLVGDEIHDGIDQWRAVCQADIERQPAAMAAAVAPLLRGSKEIIFVDPYFNPGNPRFTSTLVAFLQVAHENKAVLPRVLVFRKAKGSFEPFTAECFRRLSRHIPKWWRLELITLEEKVGGEKLHDRFLLTDRWGVQFSVGLDAGLLGQRTLITLLSESVWRSTLTKYHSDNRAFDMIGTPVIVEGIG